MQSWRSQFVQKFVLPFLLVFGFALQVHAENHRYTIPVIHSWHDILWDRLWERGLESKLAKDKYVLQRFDLDAMRLNAEELAQRGNQALKWIEELNPPLVILGDDYAMKSLATKLLDRGERVVFLGINHNPRKYVEFKSHYQITGVLERSIYKRAITELAELWPERFKKVLLLNEVELGASEIVTDLDKQFKGKKVAQIGSLSIDLEIAPTWEIWKEKVLSAREKGYDAVLFDSRYMLRDETNRYIEPEREVVAWMQKNCSVPIFSFYEDSVGPELATRGLLVSGIEQGEKAGALVKMVLEENIPPNQIRMITTKSGKWIFSRALLEKWNLTLPDHFSDKVTFVEDIHNLYVFK